MKGLTVLLVLVASAGAAAGAGMRRPMALHEVLSTPVSPRPPPGGSGRAARRRADPLDGFDAFMEELMACTGHPGISVGVVFNGSVVMSRGFGLEDVAAGRPMSGQTPVSIGSVSKSFTALALALAAEDGALSLDDPSAVHTRLQDEFADARATVRDLLGHRTGLPRHDLTWAIGNDVGRDGLLDAAWSLDPVSDLRETWHYSNVMYSAAGRALEDATGIAWADFVRDRLLLPLGMNATSVTVAEALEKGAFATPYFWSDEGLAEVKAEVNRNVDIVAPAGSIVSTADDMCKYLQMLLDAGGELTSPQTLAEVLRPVAVITELIDLVARPSWPVSMALTDYALGWMPESYRGYRRFGHSGAVFGHSSEASFFPEVGLGIVTLANVQAGGNDPQANVLQRIHWNLADRFIGLDEWMPADIACGFPCSVLPDYCKEREAAPVESAPPQGDEPIAVADYLGTYAHPAYGRFVVEEAADGSLFARMNQVEGALVGLGETDTFLAMFTWPSFSDQCSPLTCAPPMPVRFVRSADASTVVAMLGFFEEELTAKGQPIRFERAAGETDWAVQAE